MEERLYLESFAFYCCFVANKAITWTVGKYYRDNIVMCHVSTLDYKRLDILISKENRQWFSFYTWYTCFLKIGPCKIMPISKFKMSHIMAKTIPNNISKELKIYQ